MEEVSKLPSGFSEARLTEQTAKLKQADFPWLPEDKVVRLSRIGLRGGGEFYLGSALAEKLAEAAHKLEEGSSVTNKLLYSHLPEFVRRGSHPYVRQVEDARSRKPIYEIGSSYTRVFFTRLDNLADIPVIIRIAVCGKNTENTVLGVISYSSHKSIKQRAKL